MNPLAAIAVKTVGGAGAAALLSLGLAGGLAQAATPSPSPSTNASQPSHDVRADRRAIRRAVVEAEADVLGIKPQQLVKDLKAGQKVSDLAKDKGITEQQFEAKLIADLRPRLEALVDHHQITQAQADRVLDRIGKGHVPFWNGVHRRN